LSVLFRGGFLNAVKKTQCRLQKVSLFIQKKAACDVLAHFHYQDPGVRAGRRHQKNRGGNLWQERAGGAFWNAQPYPWVALKWGNGGENTPSQERNKVGAGPGEKPLRVLTMTRGSEEIAGEAAVRRKVLEIGSFGGDKRGGDRGLPKLERPLLLANASHHAAAEG